MDFNYKIKINEIIKNIFNKQIKTDRLVLEGLNKETIKDVYYQILYKYLVFYFATDDDSFEDFYKDFIKSVIEFSKTSSRFDDKLLMININDRKSLGLIKKYVQGYKIGKLDFEDREDLVSLIEYFYLVSLLENKHRNKFRMLQMNKEEVNKPVDKIKVMYINNNYLEKNMLIRKNKPTTSLNDLVKMIEKNNVEIEKYKNNTVVYEDNVYDLRKKDNEKDNNVFKE
ncbi:hypothetical protein A0H76_1670 [Hepatospora eriocheir]|uniref:Uncharacterized protein n=1 Tax=Hepatospora eriocheir TaxID=1081669 RepID=A0A1X0QGN8_9MICR|nr:hypothetical protein A0H76_1670 [Hepatospora eriocheir]